jgi:hypothetical protein
LNFYPDFEFVLEREVFCSPFRSVGVSTRELSLFFYIAREANDERKPKARAFCACACACVCFEAKFLNFPGKGKEREKKNWLRA